MDKDPARGGRGGVIVMTGHAAGVEDQQTGAVGGTCRVDHFANQAAAMYPLEATVGVIAQREVSNTQHSGRGREFPTTQLGEVARHGVHG
jgi:hypothetical protein